MRSRHPSVGQMTGSWTCTTNTALQDLHRKRTPQSLSKCMRIYSGSGVPDVRLRIRACSCCRRCDIAYAPMPSGGALLRR